MTEHPQDPDSDAAAATPPSTNGAASDFAAVAAKREMTPRGHKLPQIGFSDVRPLVEAMVELNGPSSRNLIFGQADAAATGGTAKTKWAALGYYGFRVDLADGKFDVSDRGRAYVSADPAVSAEAKRHALVGTGFRAVLERFSTRPVNETVLAGVLHEDFEVPEAKAKASAALLVSLATEAGFIVDNVFKPGPIEEAMAAVPAAGPGKATSARAATPKPPTPPRPSTPPAAPAAPAAPPPVVIQHTPPATPQPPIPAVLGAEVQAGPFGVSLEIKIEAQNHTPEEIGEIVRQVRQALLPTED